MLTLQKSITQLIPAVGEPVQQVNLNADGYTFGIIAATRQLSMEDIRSLVECAWTYSDKSDKASADIEKVSEKMGKGISITDLSESEQKILKLRDFLRQVIRQPTYFFNRPLSKLRNLVKFAANNWRGPEFTAGK
jgi:hypothetical protein